MYVFIKEIGDGFIVEPINITKDNTRFFKTFEEVLKHIKWLYDVEHGMRYFKESEESDDNEDKQDETNVSG